MSHFVLQVLTMALLLLAILWGFSYSSVYFAIESLFDLCYLPLTIHHYGLIILLFNSHGHGPQLHESSP